jgi:hypothetical protein
VQLSDLVIDSRPPLALRGWADEEAELGRRAELEAFGQPVAPAADKLDFETNAGSIALSAKIANRKAFEEALFEYDRAAMLYDRADGEFAQHIVRFAQSEQTYQSHRLSARAQQALVQADADYLRAVTAPADKRGELIAKTIKEYELAANLQRVVLLKFSVRDEVAETLYPKGMTRQNVNENSPQLAETTDRAVTAMEQLMTTAGFLDDSGEYLKYIDRANARIKQLQAAQSK